MDLAKSDRVKKLLSTYGLHKEDLTVTYKCKSMNENDAETTVNQELGLVDQDGISFKNIKAHGSPVHKGNIASNGHGTKSSAEIKLESFSAANQVLT